MKTSLDFMGIKESPLSDLWHDQSFIVNLSYSSQLSLLLNIHTNKFKTKIKFIKGNVSNEIKN
jgi:hypothetical protein